MAKRINQFRTLLWQKFTRRQRSRAVMLLEVVWPVTLFAIVIAVRQGSLPERRPECFYRPRSMPSAGAFGFLQSHLCTINNRCQHKELYRNTATHQQGLGGSGIGQPPEQFSFNFPAGSGELLAIIPKVLHLVSKLKHTLSQPGIEDYITAGGLHLRNFIKDEAQLRENFRRENIIIPPDLFNQLLAAEISTGISSSNQRSNHRRKRSTSSGQPQLFDLKRALCDPSKLGQVLHLPEGSTNKIQQVSAELCNAKHQSISQFADLLTDELSTTSITHKLVDGAQSLMRYQAEDAVNDVAIIANTLAKTRIARPLINALPLVGNIGNIISDINNIVINSRNVRSFRDVVTLAAPLIGNLINDTDFTRQLINVALSVDNIVRVIGKATGSYSVKMIDILPQRANLQLKLYETGADRTRIDRALKARLQPGRVREMSTKQRLGYDWYNDTCVSSTNPLETMFESEEDADNNYLKETICNQGRESAIRDFKPLLDYTGMTSRMDQIQQARALNAIDYIGIAKDVATLSTGLYEISSKITYWIQNINSLTSKLGKDIQQAVNITFVLDDNSHYGPTEILDVIYHVFAQTEELRSLAASIHLARQIVMSSEHNFVEFTAVLKDPLALGAVLLGSDITPLLLDELLFSHINLAGLLGISQTAEQGLTDSLCAGGKVLSLIGLATNLGVDPKKIEDALCKGINVGAFIDIQKLLGMAVFNYIPNYMLYGNFWHQTLSDLKVGVIDGIGSIVDLAMGNLKFESAVLLKPLYYMVKDLGVSGRATLNSVTPSIFDLIKDKVKKPTYFTDDMKILSKGLLTLSIFERTVPIVGNLRDNTKHPLDVSQFLQTRTDLSSIVSNLILQSEFKYNLKFHINDVTFDGQVDKELCGAGIFRSFLHLPNVTDANLRPLTDIICSQDSSRIASLVRTFTPQFNIKDLVKHMLDLSPTYLLESSNLTQAETRKLAQNIGPLGAQIGTFLSQVQNVERRKNKTYVSTTSMLESYGQQLCGNKDAFNFGAYGASFLSAEKAADEKNELDAEEETAKKESRWTPIQLEEMRELNDSVCVEMYKSINSLAGIGPILWSFLKPLTRGKILFTPNNTVATALMEEAYWLFDSVAKIRATALNWIEFASQINDSSSSGGTPQGFGDLQSSLNNPLVNSAIQQLVGVSAQALADSLDGTGQLSEPDLDQLTELARTIAKYIKCLDYGLEGYETEKALRERAEDLSKTGTLFAGVVFHNMEEEEKEESRRKRDLWQGLVNSFKPPPEKPKLPKHLEYILLITVDHVVIPNGIFSRVKQAGPDDDFLDDLRYLWGFVVMQDLIENAFIQQHMKQYNTTVDLPRISTQAFPYPCYDLDQFMVWSSFVIVIILLFSWLCMMAVGITSAVSEKETGIEDTMLVMGMNARVNRLAWFTNTLLGMLFLSLFVTALIRGGKLVQHSDPILIFLWLATYSVSIVMLCYLVSVLVHRTTLASLFGLAVYLMLCIPFIILHSMGIVFFLDFRQKVLMSLSVTSAFCFGANELIVTEKNGQGITWDSAFTPTGESFPFAWSCIMTCVDTVIYFLISWYISNKFPGKHGFPQPWYFPVSPYYWGCWQKKSDSFDPEEHQRQISKNPEHVPGEDEPTDLPIGMSLCGITKVYNKTSNSLFGKLHHVITGKKMLKAVDNLSVNFFEGQITAFLGHNGAGKSTCIHMLTGLIFPNEGTAFINGRNIKDGFDEIRKTLGFCPQHDVLFDYMTIKEHFTFYARIKGHSSMVDTQEEVAKMLDLTGLRKFKHIPVSQLSGGQRRRVSVGNAFIGGSKVIILDEPTAGVDPAARRLIWDIISRHKKDRTILLCTHHLDEADILGDRIVIMHQGKLICSGSSLWLKKQYGSGYQLTISKMTEAHRNRDPLSSRQPGQWSTAAMLRFVREFVPKAQIVEEIGTEVTIVLPTKRGQNIRFQELFVRLEACKGKLHVDKYGIADSTLEEVFLKVTRWTDMGRSLDQGDIQGWFGTIGNDNMAFENDNSDLSIRNDSGTGSFQLSVEDGSSLAGSSSGEFSQIGSGSRSDSPTDSRYSSMSGSSAGSLQGAHDDMTLVDTTNGRLSKSRRVTGMSLKWRQFMALLTKRFHHHRRDLKSHISQIILPSTFVCLAMMATWFTPVPGLYNPFKLDVAMYGPDQEIVFSVFNSSQLAEEMIDTLKVYPSVGTSCMPIEPLNPYFLPWEGKNCSAEEDLIADFETPQVRPDRRPFYERHPNCSCSTGSWMCPAEAAGLPRPVLHTFTGDRLVNLTGYSLGLEQYLLRTFDVIKNTEVGGIFGGWTFDRSGEETTATVWYNNKGIHSLPAFYNALNNMALRANVKMHTNDSFADFGITLHNQPLNTSKWPLSENSLLMSFSDTGVSLTILIAYCFVPASYIIYVINERIRQEKRLQFLTGVGVALYWFSALLWDMVTYSITVLITIGITKAFGIRVYTYGQNLAALATMLFLFGWATIPLMYLLSRWFNNPRIGYVAAFIINLCIGINTTASVFFLQNPIFNSRPEILMARNILTRGLLIFPQFCLGDSLLKLAYHQIITDILNLFHIDSYSSPFSADRLFYHFLTLGIEGAVFFVIHLMVEINICDTSRKVRRKAYYREDSDVGLERQRVVTGEADKDLLVLYNLAKVYQTSGLSSTLAVDNLCVGVPRAECFGLLGVNGAGKTTSFKMITGEIHPSSGAAILKGKVISEDISNIDQNVGYCPQCDALDDYLTGEEMIYYYARLRGIFESDIHDVCNDIVRKFRLEAHMNKRIGAYSAGNKRKLSTALALIGDPDLVLLDEPTTGMDPGTRRLVWNNIIDVIKDKRSVILTSHSMEECDSLCTRMVIMVNGTFKCMGSSQHLKNKFGSGYTIKVRVGGGQSDSKKVINFIVTKFPGAHLKDRHLNMLEFGLPSKSCTLAALFRRLEREKTRLNIENYSVTQTTLDNVFLHFARKQSDNVQSRSEPEDAFFQGDDALDKIETSSVSEGELGSRGDDTISTPADSTAPPSYHSRSIRSIAPNAYNNRRVSRQTLDDVSQINSGSDIIHEASSTMSGSHVDDIDIDISIMDEFGGESSTDTGNLGSVDSSSNGSMPGRVRSRR